MGLVAIERIELYNPKENIFLNRLLSLVNGLSGSRFIVSSSTDEDYASFCNFLGEEISFELINTRSIFTNCSIYYWLPPFKVELLDDQNTFQFRRVHYLDEIENLFRMVEEAAQEEKTGLEILIYYAYEQLPSKLRIRFSSFRPDITVTNSLGSLFQKSNTKFDVIFVIGMPRDFRHLVYNINSFLKPEGTVFLIPPDDLLTYLLVWSQNEFESFPGRQLFNLSGTDLLRPVFSNLRKSILGSVDKGSRAPFWGTTSVRTIKMDYSGTDRVRYFDRDLIPFEVYERKIYLEEDELSYIAHFDHEEGTGDEIIRLETLSYSFTKSTPVIQIQDSLKCLALGKTVKTGSLTLNMVKVSLTLNHCSTILFDDYNQDAKRTSEEFEPEPFPYTKNSIGIRIKTNFPNEMEHLLYNFLPLLFRDPFELLFLLNDGEDLYIFPHQDGYFHFVKKNFYTDISSTLKNLFNFAYRAIKECPCSTGCSKCLYYAYHKDISGLNKEDFGRYLAAFHGTKENENYENLINFRKGNLQDLKKLTNFYNEIKAKVISILEKNLDITISAPVPLIVVEFIEDGVIGVYNGENVRVIPLSHQQAIGVITHEYIHNWQDEVGILSHGDKFLTEGSAQWLAAKILNHYFRIDEIELSVMGTFAETLKEYFNGFQFLQAVEEKYGYLQTLKALITNQWDPEQQKLRTRWESIDCDILCQRIARLFFTMLCFLLLDLKRVVYVYILRHWFDIVWGMINQIEMNKYSFSGGN